MSGVTGDLFSWRSRMLTRLALRPTRTFGWGRGRRADQRTVGPPHRRPRLGQDSADEPRAAGKDSGG